MTSADHAAHSLAEASGALEERPIDSAGVIWERNGNDDPGTKAWRVIERLADRFEQASHAYAEANAIERDADWFVLELMEELGELTQAWNKLSGRGRIGERTGAELSRALADETADLFGHVLLFARANGIDLPAAIERKWRFRP